MIKNKAIAVISRMKKVTKTMMMMIIMMMMIMMMMMMMMMMIVSLLMEKLMNALMKKLHRDRKQPQEVQKSNLFLT